MLRLFRAVCDSCRYGIAAFWIDEHLPVRFAPTDSREPLLPRRSNGVRAFAATCPARRFSTFLEHTMKTTIRIFDTDERGVLIGFSPIAELVQEMARKLVWTIDALDGAIDPASSSTLETAAEFAKETVGGPVSWESARSLLAQFFKCTIACCLDSIRPANRACVSRASWSSVTARRSGALLPTMSP